MAVARTVHFRVDNGDMTLVEFASGRTLLIDINIREAADDPDDDTPNVAAQLRSRLKRDSKGRMHIDAFLLTHPDDDHIRGLARHFHLGPPGEWSDQSDKIFIREMWSSATVFRRASKTHTLSDDAKAWATEARRRVQYYRDNGGVTSDGNRILLMGEDVNGKTDGLDDILIKTNDAFGFINGSNDDSFEARLLAPMPPSDDEELEEKLSKNNSSVVIRLEMKDGGATAARYMFGGDAEVAIWERVWERNEKSAHRLSYDVMIAPHHCSWHSLSWDSWSDWGEKAEISGAARNALGQARSGARIIASSCKILDDENDPPCIRAKREYEDILDAVNGTFHCLGDGDDVEPFVLQISAPAKKAENLLRKPAAAAASFTFPNRGVKPDRPDGFA
jgi:beta-lactamase superfamily II metal-dependent hydrolase